MFYLSEKNIIFLGFGVLGVASIFSTFSLLNLTRQTSIFGPEKQLSYNIGAPCKLTCILDERRNFYTQTVAPKTLIPKDDGRVRLMVEETTRYNYSTPEATAEGRRGFPRGSGSFRLNGDNRAVFLSMYHQLHCVETMGQELIKTNKSHWPHLQHCLNFLREIALCRPDLTLEAGDFTQRNFRTERMGATHVCRDWTTLHDIADTNWLGWSDFMNQHPGTSVSCVNASFI